MSGFKIKYTSLILIVCVLMISAPVSAINVDNNAKEVRRQTVFNEQLAIMENNHLQLHKGEEPISLSISEIKELYDFDGNKYTLAELLPQGYFIFHDASGVFVEYSTRTPSPYLGLSGDLYYAGVKEYYSKNNISAADFTNGGAEFKHTVLDDEFLNSGDVAEYKIACTKLNGALMTKKNEDILNYIKYDEPYEFQLNNNIIQSGGQNVSLQSVVDNGQTLVKNYGFFSRLKNCGYISGGKCGYIAAAILMAYRQHTFGETYMPASYLSYSSSVRIKMKVTPNSNGPLVAVSTNANRIYYTLRNSSNTIISQSYVDANYNAWNFALWNNLAAGQYRFQVQAPGGNVETITFTKGSAAVKTNISATPDYIGPLVGVSTTADRIYYTLRNSSNGIVSQSYVDANYNSWDYSRWTGLAAGQYRLQVQSTGGNVETFTFTVNDPSLSTALATTLYNVGVENGHSEGTYSRDISDTVNNYLIKYGYDTVNYTDLSISANNSQIEICIYYDKPVIIFGKIYENTFDNQENINHAVIAYGHTEYYGYDYFISHFGWTNATEVYFTGLLGSIYTCWR